MDVHDTRRHRGLLACAVLLAWPLAAPAAQPPVAAPEDGETLLAVGAQPLGRTVAEDTLAGLNGGETLALVSVDSQGNVAGNSATGVVSGGNRIDGGAFANASGLNTVIQNSGSNVLIQNGTSLNVRFTDPGR